MLEIFDSVFDEVIQSFFIDLKVDYEFALENFFPRISELDFQRNPLNKKFYQRLEDDIVEGCIMPPITIAIKDQVPRDGNMSKKDWKNYVEANIDESFVLDGIQRLSTLERASKKEGFDSSRPLFVNILICQSMNKLLYRMITLNNGQKSMSARHQIEILADKLIDFEDFDIQIVTEKDKKYKDTSKVSLNKEDVIKAYLAFMSSSVNIDNQKIISSRMDSLLTDKIIQSDLNSRVTEFYDVLRFISIHMENSETVRKWIAIPNNLIGFSASSATNFCNYQAITTTEFEEAISLFERSFNDIDVSKIQLGKARRRMVEYFFNRFESLSRMSDSELLDRISQEI